MPQFAFPGVIDASMRSDFVSCPMRFYRAHVQRITLPEAGVHLHFGGCFAKGLEYFRRAYFLEGKSHSDALVAGLSAIVRSWGEYETDNPTKNLPRCLEALDSYFVEYDPAREIYRPTQVECTFAIPLDIRHPQSGDPILYAGRFDAFCRTEAGAYFILDDKTASQLGASWLNQWKIRGQFTGYAWGAREYGVEPAGILIRGVGILRTQTSHAQVIEQRGKWMIERYKKQLERDIRRMIQCWQDDAWDQAFDHACSDFGGCSYLTLCDSPNPANWEAQYVPKTWNPLETHP